MTITITMVMMMCRVAPFALVPLLGDPIRMASFYTPRTAPPPEQLEYLAQARHKAPPAKDNETPRTLALASVKDANEPMIDNNEVFHGDAVQSLISMIPLLGMLTDLLPSDTLEWKIKILSEGCKYTLPKYNQVRCWLLVVTLWPSHPSNGSPTSLTAKSLCF